MEYTEDLNIPGSNPNFSLGRRVRFMNVNRVMIKIPTIFDSFIVRNGAMVKDVNVTYMSVYTGIVRDVGVMMDVIVTRVQVTTEMCVDRRPKR